MFEPFLLLENVVEKEEEWNSNDDKLSVYLYTSVLGSEIFWAFVALTVQLLTSLILLYNNMLQTNGVPVLSSSLTRMDFRRTGIFSRTLTKSSSVKVKEIQEE